MQKKKLPSKTAVNLLDATALMNLQYGIAFNSMITLNFGQAGLTEKSEISATLTNMNKAIARRFRAFDSEWQLNGSHPCCYIYVHEYVKSKGHHLHQLVGMHEGIHASFPGFLARWAERNLPAGFDPAALHYRGLEFPSGKTRAENQAHLVRYILKATEDSCWPDRNSQPKRLRSMLGLEERNRYYVADIDRPAGVSQNLAKQAQLRAQVSHHYEYRSVDQLLSDDYLAEFYWAERSKAFTENLRRVEV